ncbi:MAG: hypothetical protein JKX98_03450 [Alcanivoracaceae bacterium]|nr:hypothetical protein [Alcanivoracaceae bacterium]
MNPRIIIIGIVFIITGCAPTSYVYVKANYEEKQITINKVLIMVEYLDIKDDFTGLWNFDEDINIVKQDELFDIASQMLISKGYEIADMSLKTSGFIIARNFLAEHYINRELQPHVIAPPYIVRSVNLDNANIQGLEVLLAELNRPISPVMSDLRSYITNNYKEQMAAINISNDTAILIIQSYKPRVSAFANIDIGFSSSSYGNSSYIGFGGNRLRPSSYAYFIHKGTGDVIWSNKTSLIQVKSQENFFHELPEKLHSIKKLSE